VPLNLRHFLLRAQDSGDWKEATITRNQVARLIKDRIDAVSMDAVKEDIVRFIPDDSVLDIWSPNYFHNLLDKLRFE
jgi:hypothetical protein